MNKHMARAKRWLAKNGGKLPHHLAERARVVPARLARVLYNTHASKYLPHQGKRECARRVKQMAKKSLIHG